MPALSALPALEVSGRLDRLRPLMAEAGVDALMVTSLFNVRYLTGFTGSAGTVVVFPDDAVLVTDGRYATQSAEQLTAAGVDARIEIVTGPGQKDLMISLVPAGTRLGLEAAHVSWARQRIFEGEWYASSELIPTTGLVEGLRRTKDAGELARVARAAAIADQALANVIALLDDGPTEAAFALALDTEMRRLGADEPSFDTIVAGGPNSAKPHHRPSDRKIGKGEPIVLDFGARVDGYCSDMTRTVSVGAIQDREMARVFEVVLESQATGVAAVRSGVATADVDRACREVIEGAGWGELFVHSTGHGVGLEIHEAPTVAGSSEETLEVGQIVTVEPGIYMPGVGGVRIEDTLAVTESAGTVLTCTPK